MKRLFLILFALFLALYAAGVWLYHLATDWPYRGNYPARRL